MNESQISVRYAKALFHSASEKGILDTVQKDMELLTETCALEDFQYVLSIPSLQVSQKSMMVGSILGQHLSEISLSLVNLVIKNKREVFLAGIARNFSDLYRKAKGIRSATLVTAQPVEEASMQGIKELIKKAYDADVELTSVVNDEIIGGFVLTVEDRQYDASVASNLKKIKKQLLQTSIEKN